MPSVRAAGEPARSTSGGRLGVWQGRQNYRPARLEDMTEGRQRGESRADAVERLLACAVEKFDRAHWWQSLKRLEPRRVWCAWNGDPRTSDDQKDDVSTLLRHRQDELASLLDGDGNRSGWTCRLW